MNELRDLAHASLATYGEHVSPDLQRAREMMNGVLGRVGLEGHIAEAKQADANFELAEHFAGILPRVKSEYKDPYLDYLTNAEWSFGVNDLDQDKARALQAGTIWVNYEHSFRGEANYPYYIIGQRVMGRSASLLLLAALGARGLPKLHPRHQIEPWQPETLVRAGLSHRALKVAQQGQDSGPYSREELGVPGFFDHQQSVFSIKADSPGSIKGRKRQRDPRQPASSLRFSDGETLETLNHADFLTHDVFSHMCKLAAKFRKQAQFDCLIDQSAAFDEQRP